ncbi:MAG TPA: hypothetical protein VFC58_08655 [Desulfosporosinus sp.]|nr:hypothetical protein [Desulfosporosinus sp.]
MNLSLMSLSTKYEDHPEMTRSELVQLKLNIETSVADSTSPKQGNGVPLPIIEVGV